MKCLFILPDSLSFVKLFFNFFRSFSHSESLNLNFSKLFVRFRCPCGQLIYNTTPGSPCQQLFSTFLTHYSKSFKLLRCFFHCGGRLSETAYIEYHYLIELSTKFFHFLSTFFLRHAVIYAHARARYNIGIPLTSRGDSFCPYHNRMHTHKFSFLIHTAFQSSQPAISSWMRCAVWRF